MRKVANEIKINRVNRNRAVLVAFASLCINVTSSGQNINDRKLINYRPVSIYNVPVTNVTRAKYPAIDMHAHVYGQTDQDIARWIKVMDVCGIEKAIAFTGATGARFDTLVKMYSKYGNRFELWCGFDFSGYDKPGYGPEAVKELERCFNKGAKGVGEVMFKGKGITPSSKVKTNRGIRKYIKTKSIFQHDQAALKVVFLAIGNIEKKWTMPIQNWGLILHQFLIKFEDRCRI
ncbi:MAG: hypothetical protein MUO72_17470 [Bacteroidales bacterium]|nr:hypothetical protein [Bacteroidales bacterium]